jgi:cofilin
LNYVKPCYQLPFSRAPEVAPTREKMIYTSTKDSIKKKLTGLQIEIQATDASELAEETIVEKVTRGS